ncbi:MAG: DUF4159 domain-containing protein [Planctomycetales bacterium]|nr:DUF4159 domain-containing protein [Planctomycetales bacterium]
MRLPHRILGWFATLLALVLSTTWAGIAQAQRGERVQLSAEAVRTSIEQAKEYLLKEQSPKGTWDELGQYPGGVTALVTLALLNAGVPASDPHIQKALDFLRPLQPTKTYVVSLQTMVLAEAEPRRDQALIQRNVRWLESIQIKDGDRAGSWSYPQGMGGDNSNSQFAVLALYAAEHAGAQVQKETWELAEAYWRKCQRPDGAWGYQPDWVGIGSMTCAGVGAMIICTGQQGDGSAKVDDQRVECCLPAKDDDWLKNAERWMGRNFSVAKNPGSRAWHYYYLYGLERFGRLTARRFIGEHDWYREGAEFLLSQQDPFSHHWTGSPHAEDNPHIATSLALLFLSKGRWPVLMGKLEYGSDHDWDNHPGAVGNLTSFTEKQWNLKLTWQVINGQQAQVEDLLQTPVLFVSGSKAPELGPLATKTRDYLDRGGFLFAEACCAGGGAFDAGFRKFMEQVFPEPEYRLRRAGPEHPIWRIEKLVRPESPYVGRLWTVEYGCRTCAVFSEVDLSCYWELDGRRQRELFPDGVEQRIDDAMAIGINVLAYATNREPKGKEESFALPELANAEVLGGRGVIRIAKLMHGGGCNDAPGALANLLRAAGQGDLKLSVSGEEFELLPSDPALMRFHMAFMHGRQDFHFTPQERKALAEYLNNGGTLLADAICASKEFAAAFRREMGQVLPEQKLHRVPTSHPLFSTAAGGYDIHRVGLREPAVAVPGQPIRSRVDQVDPEIEGIEIDGRLAVIFSPYDISCALEQHEALGCRGYTREDAARIGLNAILYSLSPDAGEPVAAR